MVEVEGEETNGGMECLSGNFPVYDFFGDFAGAGFAFDRAASSFAGDHRPGACTGLSGCCGGRIRLILCLCWYR